MGFANIIGRYQLGRTIGEGTFAKVKLAMNIVTHQNVAIKIIDKAMVIENKLMYQIEREISAMRLLHHPNIVRIYEVIATKTKIYIVMEYISGGQLSNKLDYLEKLSEGEARKYFQQLIDAVDYCHSRGVYHRDLKPENLLLDSKGNLKVTDFGLSVFHKHGDLLSTACGSPSYVAPEVIAHKNYDGSAADVWSCGVILFELLAGYLPFEDRNLMNLYRKISRADYKFPEWFTKSQKNLISKILDPSPIRRMTVAEILEDEWFQTTYERSTGINNNGSTDSATGIATETMKSQSPSYINAFQLIAMSNDLDLSGLFEEKIEDKQKTRLGSTHPTKETIEKIEVAAKNASLTVERINNFKVKLHQENKLAGCSRSHFNLIAEVIEVTPEHCVVEISKSAGGLTVYKEFCESLSSLVKDQ
ncbi:Protein kinase domain [Macleaya cordata]|uniref:non-specific serine/threonine protein kinase n=1 Tax=Macleaya cordata TaxID=56857 RepID=A0A200R0R2_MACCD|nr:Protein kinase domain [Macleaya cordata]